MYSQDDIKSLSWKELVVQRQESYFGTKGANPQAIASGIANGALVLGCKDVEIRNIDEFWIISSSEDWIKAVSAIEVDEKSVFETHYAIPEAGQNFFRYESLAEVFSTSLFRI